MDPVRQLAQLVDRELELAPRPPPAASRRAAARARRARPSRAAAAQARSGAAGRRRVGRARSAAARCPRRRSCARARRAAAASRNCSRSVTTAARLRVESTATAMKSCVLSTLRVIEVKWNGPCVVGRVPDDEDRRHGERERGAALPEAQRGPDQRREDEVGERAGASRRELGQPRRTRPRAAPASSQRAAPPALRQRPVPGQRERHDEQRAGRVAEPPGAPDGREYRGCRSRPRRAARSCRPSR